MLKNKLFTLCTTTIILSFLAFSSNAASSHNGRVCSGARPDNTKEQIQALISCYKNRIDACNLLKLHIKNKGNEQNRPESTLACPKRTSDSLTAIGSYTKRDHKRIRGANRKLKKLL